MKQKLKIRTIEDIALQFIRHSEPRSTNFINTNKTLIDYKFQIKNITNSKNKLASKNKNQLVFENNKENISLFSNITKNIKLFKVPQKELEEDDECLFHADLASESTSSEVNSQIKPNPKCEVKIREIKGIKLNTKKAFNLNYQNIYNSISEIYFPLLQNLDSIFSLKTTTTSTVACIDYFSGHDSVFTMNDLKGKTNLEDFLAELRIFEIVELSLVLFLLHIILEAKIEYIDSISEEDILIIYQDVHSVIQKLYEIIILLVLYNDNYNNPNKKKTEEKPKNNEDSISFEALCLKYVKDYYKYIQKPTVNEQIINQINENVFAINNILFNSCNTLYGNLVLFKFGSGNINEPDKEEQILINSHNINDNKKEKIFLSKEFIDQYNCYKMMYLFFTKVKPINKDNNTPNDNITESELILRKLTSMSSSYKEFINNFLLYYTNYKVLIEKNKVKPPFLPPQDTQKYKYSLILDLDETLVHYVEEENRAFVQVRPYADFFLNEMAKYFELIVFTAAAEDYADIVLNELDKNKVINYKLYRKHTEQINGVFIKDLSKIGRDLTKILIIDNNKDNFSLQPQNGLHICSFVGDQNDDELYILSSDLMKIIESKLDDIRPVIKEISNIMKKRYEGKDVILE